tara:strand:+ start:2044 stop:3783 length:1740 start_codon:yes stop_codon:yes gene_type:complete
MSIEIKYIEFPNISFIFFYELKFGENKIKLILCYYDGNEKNFINDAFKNPLNNRLDFSTDIFTEFLRVPKTDVDKYMKNSYLDIDEIYNFILKNFSNSTKDQLKEKISSDEKSCEQILFNFIIYIFYKVTTIKNIIGYFKNPIILNIIQKFLKDYNIGILYKKQSQIPSKSVKITENFISNFLQEESEIEYLTIDAYKEKFDDLSKIQYIGGPISIQIYEIFDKKILFLNDCHVKYMLKKQNSIIEIHDLINKILFNRINNKCIDIFVETKFIHENKSDILEKGIIDTSLNSFYSTINCIREYFKECYLNRTDTDNCIYSNTRWHSLDIRQSLIKKGKLNMFEKPINYTINRIIVIIGYYWGQLFNNKNINYQIIKCYKMDKYIEQRIIECIKYVCGFELTIKIIENLETNIFKIPEEKQIFYYPDPRGMGHIASDIESLKNIRIVNLKRMKKLNIDQLSNFEINFIEFYSELILEEEDGYFNILMFLQDFYFLTRLFTKYDNKPNKNIGSCDKQLYNKNIISFLGAYHTKYHLEFLNKYYLDNINKKLEIKNDEEYKPYRVSKVTQVELNTIINFYDD